MPSQNTNYELLRQYNGDWFVQVGTMSNTNWLVYGVSVPHPTKQACEEASRAAAQ
jgi:hypothetical protein